MPIEAQVSSSSHPYYDTPAAFACPPTVGPAAYRGTSCILHRYPPIPKPVCRPPRPLLPRVPAGTTLGALFIMPLNAFPEKRVVRITRRSVPGVWRELFSPSGVKSSVELLFLPR